MILVQNSAAWQSIDFTCQLRKWSYSLRQFYHSIYKLVCYRRSSWMRKIRKEVYNLPNQLSGWFCYWCPQALMTIIVVFLKGWKLQSEPFLSVSFPL